MSDHVPSTSSPSPTLQAKIEPGYWSNLSTLKLEELKLEEGPLQFQAAYGASNHAQLPSLLSLAETALEADRTVSLARGTCKVYGTLYCLNTIEQVINADREVMYAAACAALWDKIQSGEAEENPKLLNHALMLAYCDLKQYKYCYWLGSVLLQPPQAYSLVSSTTAAACFAGPVADQIMRSCEGFVADASPENGTDPFFWLMVDKLETLDLGPQHQQRSQQQVGSFVYLCPLSKKDKLGVPVDNPTIYLVMIDPANLPMPGWPLQNALLLAAARWKVSKLQVLFLRQRRGRYSSDASLVLTINLPQVPPTFHPLPAHDQGWELNSQDQAAPRTADLSPFMDPVRLAASAVDLNLKLMKWRAVKELDIGAIARTPCLLLGAGTLGCSVARGLLGWGVRKITFVDNSKVAYSNPVRQSLFVHEDCLQGGKRKAQAAAEAIERIFPGVESRGVEINIPMPGHPPAPSELDQVRQDIATLGELIQEHDVVFLLLDTRESRWLPALMCAAGNKLAITAALGFDGFVVMRHGQGPLLGTSLLDTDTKDKNSAAGGGGGCASRLGCYFCNDVVAPGNSTRDRTMDQQCTVARPGLSGIAGSLAVEMMVSVVQHPLGIAAPAADCDGNSTNTIFNAPSTSSTSTQHAQQQQQDLPLGQVPHMIRGQLNGFTQTSMRGQAFSQCTACSPTVVAAYDHRGAEFVVEALMDPRYLEELTGLAQLKREFDEAQERRAEELSAAAAGGGSGRGSGEEDEWEEL